MTLAMQPLTTCVGFLMLSLGPVSALQPGAAALRLRASPSVLRTRVTTMEAAPTQCALISLSAEDPLRLAQVLKKAWMEGGVKRGLVGSVLVGAPARCRVTAASAALPLAALVEASSAAGRAALAPARARLGCSGQSDALRGLATGPPPSTASDPRASYRRRRRRRLPPASTHPASTHAPLRRGLRADRGAGQDLLPAELRGLDRELLDARHRRGAHGPRLM